MKKNLTIPFILLLSIITFAASPTWETPKQVRVASFAVNEYSHAYYGNIKNLNRSDRHERMFIETLFSRVKQKYPNKKTYSTYRDFNISAKKDQYGTAVLYQSEFVFFSGHGKPQQICLYDYPMNISSGCGSDVCPNDQCGKVYGGETRWVIFDACLTLNVNKDGKLEKPLTAETVDLSKVGKLISVFKGVHAILGFYSLSWEDYKYADFVYASENLYDYFTKYFIEEGETIWDSFNMANADLVNDFTRFGRHTGLKPAIAFLRGFDENGIYHDTSMERFDHTFNRPIKINGSLEFFVMYDVHGEPEFYSPDTAWI